MWVLEKKGVFTLGLSDARAPSVNVASVTFLTHMHTDCIFFIAQEQSDREKEEGVPVSPFMDRDKVTQPNVQIGFIKFVIIPLFETLSKVSVDSVKKYSLES